MSWLRTEHIGNGAAAVLAALAMAGCSSGPGGLGTGPLPYQHSNFGQGGYSESLIGPDRYRIEVKGPPTTSRARLEKIAAVRAAEIGRDNRLGFFKIDGVQHGTHCQKVNPGPRAPAASGPKTLSYAILTADVSYAKTPPDPSYRDSRLSFDPLRAELEQDAALSAPADAAAGQCAG
jgi:hypothetical protein